MVLVDELVRCGVLDAVLCPGSRNSPLSFALFEADAAGRLRLHVRIDERGAGFLALGVAAYSNRPVAVFCTSGTAAANLHPAVLEADHAGVPLLMVTADRPAELVGTGASQTISQAGLYGSASRMSITLGVAERRAGQNAWWRSTVCRAVAAATGDPPGPVQLDVPLREPLVPDVGPDQSWPEPLLGRAGGQRWTAWSAPDRAETSAGAEAPAGADMVARAEMPAGAEAPAGADVLARGGVGARSGSPGWELAPRTLVIAGYGAGPVPDWLAALPRVAEPGSPLWGGSLAAGPWLLGALDQMLRPEHVVVVGRPTLHRSVQRLLADPAVRVTVLSHRPQWTDVAGTAHTVHRCAPSELAVDVDQSWADWLRAADAAAAKAVRAGLGRVAWPTGPAVARDVVAELPAGALLVLGSSNPVRDVAIAAQPRADLVVRANRGVAGIDGTVSTAIGAALAHRGPSYALLGDLTFLHDSTGLVIGPQEPRPDLTIIVLNDDGGGIFALLEQGAPEHASAFERIFGTPHGVDLAALCAATRTPYTLAGTQAELARALRPARGVRVVEVRADRGGLRELHADLRAAVAESLQPALGGTGVTWASRDVS
jgi:2-succinyl-5-enolpyruvyl-6-hydroxy-3-cyclohexene-1-carboxylate synthase